MKRQRALILVSSAWRQLLNLVLQYHANTATLITFASLAGSSSNLIVHYVWVLLYSMTSLADVK